VTPDLFPFGGDPGHSTVKSGGIGRVLFKYKSGKSGLQSHSSTAAERRELENPTIKLIGETGVPLQPGGASELPPSLVGLPGECPVEPGPPDCRVEIAGCFMALRPVVKLLSKKW
jgi:hypothetical protein